VGKGHLGERDLEVSLLFYFWREPVCCADEKGDLRDALIHPSIDQVGEFLGSEFSASLVQCHGDAPGFHTFEHLLCNSVLTVGSKNAFIEGEELLDAGKIVRYEWGDRISSLPAHADDRYAHSCLIGSSCSAEGNPICIYPEGIQVVITPALIFEYVKYHVVVVHQNPLLCLTAFDT